MIHETIGDRIKYQLKLRKMTQRELANKIGINEVTMGRYINDKRIPNADVIIAICRTLGISSDWLLGLM
jgi:transcriptional regulator with XRE-family HTH domain